MMKQFTEKIIYLFLCWRCFLPFFFLFFFFFLVCREMHQTASSRQSRIPEQQGIGQTLPPIPVGIDTLNTPPLPSGAMSVGTRLQIGKYVVIIHNFIAEGWLLLL